MTDRTVCKHFNLPRQCLSCEQEAEIDRLTSELAAAKVKFTIADERMKDAEMENAELRAEVALCNGTIESRDRNIEELVAQVERLRKDIEANAEYCGNLILEVESLRLRLGGR